MIRRLWGGRAEGRAREGKRECKENFDDEVLEEEDKGTTEEPEEGGEEA